MGGSASFRFAIIESGLRHSNFHRIDRTGFRYVVVVTQHRYGMPGIGILCAHIAMTDRLVQRNVGNMPSRFSHFLEQFVDLERLGLKMLGRVVRFVPSDRISEQSWKRCVVFRIWSQQDDRNPALICPSNCLIQPVDVFRLPSTVQQKPVNLVVGQEILKNISHHLLYKSAVPDS